MSCVRCDHFVLHSVVLWPPQPITHATLSLPASVEKRMSICSQEVSCISEQSKFQVGYNSITEINEDRPASPIPFKREPLDPKLIRTVKQTAMRHATEKIETKPKRVHSEHVRKSPEPSLDLQRPHEIKSLLLDASLVRPLSPVQVVVFPPELPLMLTVRPRSTTPSKKIEVKVSTKNANNSSEVKRCKSPKVKKIKEGNISSKVEASVNVKKQVDKFESSHQHKEKKSTSVRDLPKPIIQSGAMASALATAPDKPFKPKIVTERALVPTGKVGLPPDSQPYFPPEHGSKDEKVAQAMREVGCKSPITDMLTIAPERSYSPLPPATETGSLNNTSTTTTFSVANAGFHPIRKPVSMLSALTVAPTVPFTVPGKTPVPTTLPTPSAFKPVSPTSPTFIPVPGRPHTPMKYYPAFTHVPHPSPPPVVVWGEYTDKDHIEYDSTLKPPSTKPKTVTTVVESIKTTAKTDVSKSKQTTNSSQSETYLLPYYQQNIGEIPVRNRSISPIRQIRAPSYSPSDQVLHPPPSVRQMLQTKTNVSKIQQHYTDDKKDTFGLHAPNLLPYYQQNIGEIPVRNRSISPVPHLIRAPSCEPKVIPSPKNYCYSSTLGVPVYSYRPLSPTQTFKSTQTQTETPQIKQVKEVIKESLSEETKRSRKEEKEVHKSVTKITEGVIRPASPSIWKAKVEKTVQNLSPMTVRIPSPIPKPLGHTKENVGSNIHIVHHRDHTSTVSVTPIPDENNNMQDSKGKTWSKTSTPTKFKESSQVKSSIKTGSLTGKHVSYDLNQNIETPGKLTSNSTHDIKPISNKTSTQVVEKTNNTLGQKTYREEKTSNVMAKQFHDERYVMSSQVTGEGYHAAVSDVTKESVLCKGGSKGISPAVLSSKTCINEKYSASSSPLNSIVKSSEPKHVSSSFLGNNLLEASEHGKSSTQSGSICSSLTQKSYATEKHVTGDSKSVKKTVVTSDSKVDGSGHFLSQSLLSLGGSSSGGNGTGGGAGGKGSMAGTTAPRRGQGVLNPNTGPQARIPLCGQCNKQIRGPFITALGKIWCPEHFICVNAQCRRPLQDIGFVEEQAGLYCEYCFEKYLAPNCSKCNNKIKGDCLNAIGKQFHPECFCCTYCGKMFGSNPFFLEDSLPYCETDWNELFTTKCFACGFPIEAGDRWVEALNNNYHSQCFNCSMCKKNLEGQSFYAKGGRPFCKAHAR